MNCSPVSECKFFSTYQGNIFVAEGPNAQCTVSGPRGGACTYHHQFLQRSLTPTFTKTVWLAGPCGAYAEPVVSCDMYHMVGSCPSFTGTKGCAFVDDQVCGGLASRANPRCWSLATRNDRCAAASRVRLARTALPDARSMATRFSLARVRSFAPCCLVFFLLRHALVGSSTWRLCTGATKCRAPPGKSVD
jgi:hypothetical protein